MSAPHPSMVDLVAEIDAFLRASPMSGPTFGHLAMRDSDLVPELRAGRRLKPLSVQRVRDTLDLWRRRYAERAAFRSNPAVQAAVAAAVARAERRSRIAETARKATPSAHARWWHPGHAAHGSAKLAAALASAS